MKMNCEADILALIAGDDLMVMVLEAVRKVDLPDGWIGAGFVRRKVWDHLHGFERATPLDDIDVLYFQPNDMRPATETVIEGRLHRALPGQPWSAKNQARMHLRNGDRPYEGTVDAMHYWLETPTCVAVRMSATGDLELAAPYGLDDLLSMTIRPTPSGRRRPQEYRGRVEGKNWLANWPRTKVIWPE
jgi:hypothetical protein